MKQAVGQRVVLQTPDGGIGVIALAAQQVVPLEDLVEDDAVHEPAEADPNQDSWRSRTAYCLLLRKAPYLPSGRGSHPDDGAHKEEAQTGRSRRRTS